LNVRGSNKKLKPNKLILPAIILACIPAIAVPVTIAFPSIQNYLIFFLPFGILAAVLARIALYQIKRGFGTRQERNLALITYFLGLSPVLYFFGIFTYSLLYP
jgi:ABC-type maltose transport system permease subunit